MGNELKLYVWENSFDTEDFCEGIMLALAKNVEEARKNIIKKVRLHLDENDSLLAIIKKELEEEPTLYTEATDFIYFGCPMARWHLTFYPVKQHLKDIIGDEYKRVDGSCLP